MTEIKWIDSSNNGEMLLMTNDVDFINSQGVKNISYDNGCNIIKFSCDIAFTLSPVDGVVRLNKNNSYYWIFTGCELVELVAQIRYTKTQNRRDEYRYTIRYKNKFCSKTESVAISRYNQYNRDEKINRILD